MPAPPPGSQGVNRSHGNVASDHHSQIRLPGATGQMMAVGCGLRCAEPQSCGRGSRPGQRPPIDGVLAAVTAARGDVLIEARLSLQLAGRILVIVDYHLLAVGPLPGPVMRIGQHLTSASFADVMAAADAVPVAAARWRGRRP